MKINKNELIHYKTDGYVEILWIISLKISYAT